LAIPTSDQHEHNILPTARGACVDIAPHKMDVEQCIALHNEILRHGWVHSGHNAESFEKECPTWYDDSDITEIEAVRHDLTPDLFNFLRKARFAGSPHFWFFHQVSSLASPQLLFADLDVWRYDIEEGEVKRYVTLYLMNECGSHPLGLM
jgi:hypothetical protein